MRWVWRSVVGLLVVSGASLAAWTMAGCSSGDDGSTVDSGVADVAPCPSEFNVCAGQCADLTNDRDNCGACGTKCNLGESCSAGKCVVGCGAGGLACDGGCVDPNTDPANCGGCGMACDPGFRCEDAGCALSCQDGLLMCASGGDAGDAGVLCTNPKTDDLHCGACGTACDPGTKCVDGTCTLSCQPSLSECPFGDGGTACADLRIDPENCGACGTACDAGTFCSPGADGGAAACGLGCFGGTTKCGNRCVDTNIDPYNCGGCNKACDGGSSCSNGTCQ